MIYDWLFDDGLIPQMKYVSQIHSPSEMNELIWLIAVFI